MAMNMIRFELMSSVEFGVVVFVLMIFNEGAYLTFKSIFQKALNLF
mgnify:CR=1 FL=1